MISTPKLKITIQEAIKKHERAIDDVPWSTQKSEIKVKIKAFKEVLEMIDGPDTT